jgi:alpha-L-fucosidase
MYLPTLHSLRRRPLPAWAPPAGNYQESIAHKGWAYRFAHNPYAEWYGNSIKIADSPTHQHHLATYEMPGPTAQETPTR